MVQMINKEHLIENRNIALAKGDFGEVMKINKIARFNGIEFKTSC